jgi:acetoacetyl-CoA reductase
LTGGTRGIGTATSVTLKEKDFSVAAIYAGNDGAANAFNEEMGVSIYKTDVRDLAACEAGVAQIVADFGPIDVLVNYAGVTRGGTLHRMTPTKWQEVINTNLGSCFNM